MKLKTTPTEDGKRIRIDFTYSAAVVALVKTIPGAKFEWGSKTWTVAKRYHAKVDAFLVAAKPILEAEEKAAKEAERQAEIVAERNRNLQREARRQERAEYLAQCDRAREAKAEANRAAGKGRFGTLVENAPREGTVLRRGDEVVRVTGLGKVFRLSDDASSMGWPCGHEGERACYAYYERATPDEVAALEAREAEVKRVVEIRRRQREAVETVKMSDDRPEVGHVPEGEILWKDDRHRATGWASHVVLTADGWIWHAQYDGTDGGAWGDYNLGYNTWGGRVPATPELIAAIRGDGMET